MKDSFDMYVEDLKLDKNITASELLTKMNSMGGFMGMHLGQAYNLLLEMINERNCLKGISFTGNLIATGLRGVFVELMKRRIFDFVITTCGALDHDIARTRAKYRVGTFDVDDVLLSEQNVHRLGSVFIDQESYGLVIEREIKQIIDGLHGEKPYPVYEICWLIGERLSSENSILYWCWRNKIPVFVPGFFDGAVGYQFWLQGRQKHVWIDFFADMNLLDELSWNAEKKAGLIVGGGISKHHLLWWSQFGRDGLDIAVYISTADEYDGSLSGARPKEAVSWHKLSKKSKHVFVKADATIVLPILTLALIQSIEE